MLRIGHDQLLWVTTGLRVGQRCDESPGRSPPLSATGVVAAHPDTDAAPHISAATPPTQWAMSGMLTLRVGVVGVLSVVGGAFPDGMRWADGDLAGSDEDVFDEQPQHALALFDGGDFRVGVELGEEAFEVGGEGEVGGAAASWVSGASIMRMIPLLVLASAVSRRVRCWVVGSAVRTEFSRLSISVRMRWGSVSMPVMWSRTSWSR